MENSEEKSAADRIMHYVDTFRLYKLVGFVFTLWITYLSVTRSLELAGTVKDWSKDGVGLAAYIGALMVPVSGLQGYVFKYFYNTGA